MSKSYTMDELISGYFEKQFAEADEVPLPKFSFRHRLTMKRIFKLFEHNKAMSDINAEDTCENVLGHKQLSFRKRLIIAVAIIVCLAVMTGFVIAFKICCDGHVADHGTSDEHDLAAVLVGGVHDLLHAVHVAGEAGHDDLASGLCERLVERRTDGGLRLDEARDLGVGGVHHQQIHTLFAKLAEFHQIGDAVVERQLVELDVAGVDKRAGGGL